jgi:hypothetical protein
MADRVLCDAHVQVDPHITVSEGHRISDAVFLRVRAAHPEVQDVLVHIDVENDATLQMVPCAPLPERAEIADTIGTLLGEGHPQPLRVQLHYLGDRIEAEVILAPSDASRIDPGVLRQRISALLEARPEYRSIRFFVPIAP